MKFSASVPLAGVVFSNPKPPMPPLIVLLFSNAVASSAPSPAILPKFCKGVLCAEQLACGKYALGRHKMLNKLQKCVQLGGQQGGGRTHGRYKHILMKRKWKALRRPSQTHSHTVLGAGVGVTGAGLGMRGT